MKIIKPFERKTAVAYYRNFDRINEPGSGYSFKCTEDGTPIANEYVTVEQRLAQLARVQADPQYRDMGVVKYTWQYNDNAIGQCACGREVELRSPLYNGCDCGRGYNMSGQLLAPVEQWEPEDQYDVFGPQNAPDEDGFLESAYEDRYYSED